MTKHTKKPVFSIVVDGKPVSASEVRDMIGADYGKCQFMMLPDGTVRLRVHTQVKYAFFNLPEYCQVVLADPAANIKQLEDECSSLRNQYMSDGEELAALRARVAELEGALKNVVDGNDIAYERNQDISSWMNSDFRRIARAALKGGE
jgi:hypothetical protein